MTSQCLDVRPRCLAIEHHRGSRMPFQPALRPCPAAKGMRRHVQGLTALPLANGMPVAQPSEPMIDRRQLFMALAAASGLRMLAATTPAHAEECKLQTSTSGLQWCDLVEGQGATAAPGTLIKTHFTGSLASTGQVFESSYARKQPLIIKVGECEALEAWDMALLGTPDMPAMREGGKRRLVIPPGPLQRQGTKSLIWVVGLSQALEEADELSPDGKPTSALLFDLEYIPRRARKA